MNLYYMPSGEHFLERLSEQLLRETSDDPLQLVNYLIFLPTRRSCRALRDAFFRVSGGKALLLPVMQPLGDIAADDLSLPLEENIDLPPAIPEMRRNLLLARQILALGDRRGGEKPTPDQAFRLAVDLAGLLDQVQTEGLSFDRLKDVVPDQYADHWKITLQFLDILTGYWPGLIEEQGFIDPALRRNQIIDAKVGAWQNNPPKTPVIAAGSTGTIPAVARFLTLVAKELPQGRVILPGLDPHLDEETQKHLDHSHPQFGLYRLLDRMQTTPDNVLLWPSCEIRVRTWLAHHVFCPAEMTDSWRNLKEQVPSGLLDGVTRLDCAGPREEAMSIALILREVLEKQEQTAALITPDRTLARRVVSELRRYGVEIDDSAGQSLSATSAGAFLLLTANMLASQLAPVDLLAALKHPLARWKESVGDFRAKVRQLELYLLRGPRPSPNSDGLLAVGKDLPDSQFVEWLKQFCARISFLEPLFDGQKTDMKQLVTSHIDLVTELTRDADGLTHIWDGDAGIAARDFVAELHENAEVFSSMSGQDYPPLLRSMMDQVIVRDQSGYHPRLSILGPLESRLLHADLVILGGLNEGTWPPDISTDPWMSRPMRADFGLPPHERRIGLSAHDFVQAFCGDRLVLTRAGKKDGVPTVPSRWLRRIDTVLRACGYAENSWDRGCWEEWAKKIDYPEHFLEPVAPTPTPPLEARPRSLSVTKIETWMRDPYALYAGEILRLKKLDPLDLDAGIADYGSLIHDALHRFIKKFPQGDLPPDAIDYLLADGQTIFDKYKSLPSLMAFWWPRFEGIARWFIEEEKARRGDISRSYAEIDGKMPINTNSRPFEIRARADRIDQLKNNGLVIIDYKTGSVPKKSEISAGYAPQLPLEGVIACARAGGFDGVKVEEGVIPELEYWKLAGRRTGGKREPLREDLPNVISEAYAGLQNLVEKFDDPTTSYRSRPHPEHAPRYSDFDHLARIREWSVVGEVEDESE